MFQQQMTQHHHFHPYNHPVSPLPSRRTPSSLASFEPTLDVEIQSHRHFLKDPPPSWETPDEELGMKGNPIYVFDDDEIECDGYWDGYWDRTNTYRQYNGLWNEDVKCGKSTTLNNPHISWASSPNVQVPISTTVNPCNDVDLGNIQTDERDEQ